MTGTRFTTAFSIAIFLATTLISAQAQEKKIDRAELPAAVQKAVAANSEGATVRGYSQETERGKTYYEAEMTQNGLSKDVTMDANGNIIELEKQVPLQSLPPSVKKALETKAGQGKIEKVESLTKHGQLVAYEAQVQANGKHSEIQVGPNGQSLSHEE